MELDSSWSVATRRSPVALPGRDQFERQFGADLSDVRVFANEHADTLLDNLHADGAARGNEILVPSQGIDSQTMAHEVGHTLQARRGEHETGQSLLPAGHFAERDAERASDARSPAAGLVRASISPTTIALSRKDDSNLTTRIYWHRGEQLETTSRPKKTPKDLHEIVKIEHRVLEEISAFSVARANEVIVDFMGEQEGLLSQAQKDVILHATRVFETDWQSRCREVFGFLTPEETAEEVEPAALSETESAGPGAEIGEFIGGLIRDYGTALSTEIDERWVRGGWIADAIVQWESDKGSLESELEHLRPDLLPSRFPEDEAEFDARIEDGKSAVNLPVILEPDHERISKEFKDPITIRHIDSFAEQRGIAHYGNMNQKIDDDRRGNPKWREEANVILTQPGARNIDISLALTVALRESGPGSYRTSKDIVDTFGKGGMDYLYSSGDTLRREGLVPKFWVQDGPNFSAGKKGAAKIPRSRLLGFYLASVGHARLNLERHVSTIYGIGGPEADTIIEGLSTLARRIWVNLSFQAPGGDLDLENVSVGQAGIRTFLKAFKDAGIALEDITDIPSASSKAKGSQVAIDFLERSLSFDRLNIATKTAITAAGLD